MKIAFEFNGKQHYIVDSLFNDNNKNNLITQKFIDSYKLYKCNLMGIKLIIIPYNIKYKNMENYILNEINKYEKIKNKILLN